MSEKHIIGSSKIMKLFERIIINLWNPMDKTLKEIKEFESTKIYYDKINKDYFKYKKGKIPILISAPHGARHLRNDKWKEEDEYTASIAVILAKQTNTHVIYVKNATREDPNFCLESEYKKAIEEAVKSHKIRFILDLHGAKNNSDFKVAVGIISDDESNCSCPTVKKTIQESFASFQKDIFNRPKFKASSERTITYFAKNTLQIESAQFEINGKHRIIKRKPDSTQAKEKEEPNFKADEKDVLELFNHLKEMILKINLALSAELL